MNGTEAGWPFWAPSPDDAIERALDLAALGPGERLVDLGCGDGRVLVAAARRGARVLGIECDPHLAALAREALAMHGLDGEVVEGDLFSLDLDADVLFSYLAPATLQRLAPALRATGRRARLVTVDFAVPGVGAAAVDDRAHLYTTPLPAATPREPGWHTAGALVVTVPELASLTCLEVAHPGGPVEVALSAPLADDVVVAVGADECQPGEPLAIDLRWHGAPAGSVAWGTLRIAGLPVHALVALFATEHDEEGQWDLSLDGAADLLGYLAGGRSSRTGPCTTSELLAAAEGELSAAVSSA